MQAFAHSSTRNALLALNDSTGSAPSGGSPAGGGVLGVTTVGGAVGVFGANNHPSQGVGVQGNGPEAGLSGFSDSGTGVRSHSNHGDAIQGFGHSSDHNAILGNNDATAPAPSGGPPAGNGVFGFTQVPNASGVVGAIPATNTQGAGVTGIGPTAGRFYGDVVVTGDVQLTGGDLAEHFQVRTDRDIEPGTVMVLDGVGRIRVSASAYDRKVAGVVSGAGGYRPGLILDHRGQTVGCQPLALVGKVLCKVDASFGPVEVGDLLTTSPTPGHAMKAAAPELAFGAVLGKAMAPLAEGAGLLAILVTLQ
jgi:hypothetical protein